jgi:hypothetical protein
MATELRIRPAAPLATTKSLRLVDLLRLCLETIERLDELLADARKGLERADAIAASPGKRNPNAGADARKRANVHAVRACSGWRRSMADAERRIRLGFGGIDSLFADLGDAGCRAAAAHLARVQPLAKGFPGYSPCSWESLTVRNLAFRLLQPLRRFLETDSDDEPLADDRDAIDAAINLRRGLVLDVGAILHSREALDRLESEIAADAAELGAAADECTRTAVHHNPDRRAILLRDLEVIRGGFVAAGGEYPDGETHWGTDDGISVTIGGLSAAGLSRLRAACVHAEPILRELGAPLTDGGEFADGRILRWVAELIDPRAEDGEYGCPFALISTGISRFAARLVAEADGGETDEQPVGGKGGSKKSTAKPKNGAHGIQKTSRRGRVRQGINADFEAWCRSKWNAKLTITDNCRLFLKNQAISDSERNSYVNRLRRVYGDIKDELS